MSPAWVGIKGAARWARAAARGDVCSASAAEERANVCRGCPSLTVSRVPVLGVFAVYCGEPLRESAAGCGCLQGYVPRAAAREMERAAGGDKARLAALIRGHFLPCAAARVASKACVRGRYPAVQPVTISAGRGGACSCER